MHERLRRFFWPVPQVIAAENLIEQPIPSGSSTAKARGPKKNILNICHNAAHENLLNTVDSGASVAKMSCQQKQNTFELVDIPGHMIRRELKNTGRSSSEDTNTFIIQCGSKPELKLQASLNVTSLDPAEAPAAQPKPTFSDSSKSVIPGLNATRSQDEGSPTNLIRTPSLTSSLSTASIESTSSDVSPTYICKTQERILFQPPGPKKSRFPKSLHFRDFSRFSQSSVSKDPQEAGTPILPMIILTAPEDENDYCTVSPFALELFCPYSLNSPAHTKYLRVSVTPPVRNAKVCAKRRQWPHPAGPWLRPLKVKGLRRVPLRERDEYSPHPDDGNVLWHWNDGCRISDGTVVGWMTEVGRLSQQYHIQLRLSKLPTSLNAGDLFASKIMFPAVTPFPPPRLPNEIELERRLLKSTYDHGCRLRRDASWKWQMRRFNPASDGLPPKEPDASSTSSLEENGILGGANCTTAPVKPTEKRLFRRG